MERPSSPGTKPVDFRESIEETLKFTLESHINQTLELGLSNDFCTFLLNHVPLAADSCHKESQYPLYKRLASILHEWITSTESCGAFSNIALLNKDNDLKKREEWNELFLKEGSDIVNDVHRYQSFSEMLQAEDLAKVLPGIKTIDEGVQVYRRFYTEEKEKTNGVLAIGVATSAAQPFLCLARILSRLGYVGLESLLGITDDTATISEQLSG